MVVPLFCQKNKSFLELTNHLVSVTILTILLGSDSSTVHNYASNKGLICALLQNNRVVAYASR